MEMEVIERQISEIVKADLYERFPTGFVFDPIRVYPGPTTWETTT